MKICDTCGKECDSLNPLQSEYQMEDIAEICDACLRESSDLLNSIRKAQHIQKTNWLRGFLRDLRGKRAG